MKKQIVVHMFWAGNISRNEILSMSSFVKNGFDLNVWSFEKIPNTPKGVKLRDAKSILDIKYLNELNGRYAQFADIFRLEVISKLGGLWSDMDIISVKSVDEFPGDKKFLVTEQLEFKVDITNSMFYNPSPERGDTIDLARQYAKEFPKNKIEWSTIGPDVLQHFVQLDKQHGFDIKPKEFTNPYNPFFSPEIFLSPTQTVETDIVPGPGVRVPDTHFIHIYNECWRNKNVDKNIVAPAGSILSELESRYLEH